MAVEWIATRFAPALATYDPNATIRIIGASADMVPADWRAENVVYLGLADQAAVEREFTSADLFLAPISNLFGAKIKLLDALAFAAPFIATDQAMTGLSFLLGVPRIDLNSPQQAPLLASEPDSRPR